jgi:hypothetical protein
MMRSKSALRLGSVRPSSSHTLKRYSYALSQKLPTETGPDQSLPLTKHGIRLLLASAFSRSTWNTRRTCKRRRYQRPPPGPARPRHPPRAHLGAEHGVVGDVAEVLKLHVERRKLGQDQLAAVPAPRRVRAAARPGRPVTALGAGPPKRPDGVPAPGQVDAGVGQPVARLKGAGQAAAEVDGQLLVARLACPPEGHTHATRALVSGSAQPGGRRAFTGPHR